MIALGTQPDDDAHWFARWTAGGADYAQLHAAKPDDPPYRMTTWRKANPFDPLPADTRGDDPPTRGPRPS